MVPRKSTIKLGVTSMDNFEQKKTELNKELESAASNVGIKFGPELFKEFVRRGWFTLETFGVLGTLLFAEKVPAYQKTHIVFQSWDIQDHEFKVGKS
jgi:hypothetical protein